MKREKPKIPPISLLAMDILGGLLIVVGIMEKTGQVNWVPEEYRIENFEYIMMAVGVAMTFPLVKWVLLQAENRRTRRIPEESSEE